MDHSHGALGDTLRGDGAVLLALLSSRSILLDYCEPWHPYLLHDLSPHTVLERLYKLGPRVRLETIQTLLSMLIIFLA